MDNVLDQPFLVMTDVYSSEETLEKCRKSAFSSKSKRDSATVITYNVHWYIVSEDVPGKIRGHGATLAMLTKEFLTSSSWNCNPVS